MRVLKRFLMSRCAWLLPVVAFSYVPSAFGAAGEQEIFFREQRIWVSGVSAVQWIGDKHSPESELILVYSNAAPEAVNTLRTDLTFDAQMLVVGGGGAGGYGSTGGTNPGGGGGGGQVINLGNTGYGAGTYHITVGAGGARTTAKGSGANGRPSLITNETNEVIARALGGGGGGSQSDGNGTNIVGMIVATGGGGGGQIKTKVYGQGGLGVVSDGGTAINNSRAGGGGGATESGVNGTATKAGNGGLGASSPILLDAEGNELRYGGGGGGGQTANTTASNAGAGADGGGRGGYSGTAGEDGVDGTGGGGGGGGRQTSGTTGAVGGAGGSGIVIIRLTFIEQPMMWMEIPLFDNGKIFIDQRAMWTRADPEDLHSDIIIAFSNVTARGGLRFFDPEHPSLPPVWAEARILAVGGGGGGGMVNERNRGAGAGGGAGGFLEEGGFVFTTNHVYSIVVGAGGVAAERNDESGHCGGNSSVRIMGGGLVMSDEAYGGGGGGARSAGNNRDEKGEERKVGSGGGGSRAIDGTNREGGAGLPGQGFAGGSGSGTYSGAGGGGAGGVGGDAGGEAGVGGSGTNSWITGSEVWYAGGGGGALIGRSAEERGSGGAGGLGGGGAGAGETAAKDGVNGLGGGGGGGVSYVGAEETAGRGGDGVVIIRLSNIMVKGVPLPKANGPFTYDGEEHRGIDEFYAYELSGTPVATDANTYSVTATLKSGYGYAWNDAAGGAGSRVVTWDILQAPNVISNFHYAGYRWPDRIRAHHPADQFEVTWGKSTAEIAYRVDNGDGTYGKWENWGTDGPPGKGNYEVRVAVPPHPNWAGVTNVLAFGTWEKWSDIFSDRMGITVSENTSGSTVLTNFPVAVRVREPAEDGYGAFSGFDYVRAGPTGREIRFFDQDGDPVDHDVDVWNVRGESIVWVRVPELKGKETKLTMCWRRVNDIRIPDNDAEAVWRGNYAAVWHMTNLEGNHLPDASGHNQSLFPTGGASVKFDSEGRMGREATVVGGTLNAANVFTNAGDAAVLCTYDKTGKQTKTNVKASDVQLVVADVGKTVDEARLMAAPGDAWTAMEAATASKEVCTYGLVIRDEQLCDYWVEPRPAQGWKTIWKDTETIGAPTAGSYASEDIGGAGAAVAVGYWKMPEMEPLPSLPSGAVGYYRATFDHTAPSGQVDGVWYEYRPQPHLVDFYVIEGADPTGDLGGFGGDSGRVLLMNADNNASYLVTNQGWCARSERGVTRWVRTAGDDFDGTNNILGGTSFEFVRCVDTNVLWTLHECRQGNLFPTNDAAGLSSSLCYLPASSATALSVTNESQAATRGTTGWAMMRNLAGTEDSPGACIYSPCYTNGIGTVYFDAVNARKAVTSGTARNDDGYKLVLEIATETRDHKPPVDSNCWEVVEYGVTNRFAKLEGMWRRVTMSPMQVHGATRASQPATDELALKETQGGHADYFYRVYAKVLAYGAVRFRIRRTSVDMTLTNNDDGFILIDNVIASVPPVTAELSPFGRFDPKLAGDLATGFGGAFAVPFPSAGGAAFPGRCRVRMSEGTELEGKSPSEYISMAQIFYRWRHLGSVGDWLSAELKPDGSHAMATEGNLAIPARPGDLEFYFVSMMKTPYYKYVDYTGLGMPASAKGDYTEEITKKESAMRLSDYKVTRLASGGTNWFVRLRDGASDWEGMTAEVRGAISNDCPMRLVGDGSWRTLMEIPTNREGTCTVVFRGRNRQTAGSKDYAENATAWGGGAEPFELPQNGLLTVGGAATSFAVDHVSNYLEFKMGADASENPTWSASRAEYQNFNNWHDVWSSAESRTFATGTNGVDDVSMKPSNLDMKGWDLYTFADSAWNETFKMVNYNDPGFPKETFYQNHSTPSAWNGHNLTFVSKNLATWVDPTKADTVSGMAAKLRGQGGGILEYNKSNNPKGLEHVTFTARLGQSIGYDDISYSSDQSRKQDYTFVCPVSMSRQVGDDKESGDMSVGGAISLFAYYRESKGCYEFRVTRVASGTEILMELFKWHPVDEAMTQTRLFGQRFNFAGADSLRLWNNSGEVVPKYFAMFISARTTNNGTEVYCGVSKDERTVLDDTTTFSGNQAANGYGGLYYLDKQADRLTSGSYGVAAKDCPAQFVRPRHYDWAVALPSYGSDKPQGLTDPKTYPDPDKIGKYFTPSKNKNFHFASDSAPASAIHFDWEDIADGYWELGRQVERWTAGKGLRTRVGLSQDVVVELQPKVGGDWREVDRVPVSGYALAEKTVPLHLTGDYNLRLTTGAKAIDVVIGEVTQRQWQGLDHENLSYGSDAFVYTQGVVESNDVRQTKETLLQPSRGVVTKPLSLRSPVLDGLGKVSFSYADADPNAVVWVQVATNKVDYNLTGSEGYNLSVKSVDLEDARKGVPAPPGTWITVAKFGPSLDESPDGPLGKSGVKTVYLGWHNQANEPVRGHFRLFVPTETVGKAIDLATNQTQNVDYGRISLTGMTVTDEPGISERSWRGWNLRTLGDAADTEERMFLDDGLVKDDVSHGLACALNNSVNDIAGDDTETAQRNNPAIWSPTFEAVDGKSRSIGTVTFRARLYHPGDARETETGGVVSIWGATSSVSEPDRWTKLVDISVTSSTFSNYTWSALGMTRYRAVKLEVSGREAKTRSPDRDRVILDEIVLTEKLDAKIGFEYVRPFRTNLYEPVAIEDILSPNEQPIVGESWGVQTKLRLGQLGKDVSGLEVYFTYFTGESPWGYEQWKARAPEPVRLVPVGDAKDAVFRSVGTTPEALVQPVTSADVVQYMVILKYAGDGEAAVLQPVEREDWAQPSWYWPVDYNEKNGGNADPGKFSPYAIIDTVSPGRAWINEVNWNDGSPALTHTDTTVKTNQFIEICVPSGTDMTGWYLRATDLNLNSFVMAKFGVGGVGFRKVTPHAVNDFEFMLLESPETNLAGGIRDAEGNPVETDGTWSIAGISSTADKGTLAFNRPWQFELVRPSGVVEHQVVIGGTNTMSQYSYGYLYDATNLLAKLEEETPSQKRFLAGDEPSRSVDGRKLASIGVVGGSADANPAPGGDGTWSAPMKFTPGRLNEGQTIPAGWYLAPNGTNCWVTLTVVGDTLTQEIGGESAKVMKLIVPQGIPTNVIYRAKPWYEVADLSVDGTTVAEHQARYGQPWTYALTPTGLTCSVVATEGFDSGLDAFGLRGHPYASAVTRWLADKYPNAKAEDIQLAAWKDGADPAKALDLVSMYWLDIPPVPTTEEEIANAAAGNTNWWLCSGIFGGNAGWRPNSVTRIAHYAAGDVEFVNSQIDIQLYVSNALSAKAHAPAYLQGINYERSDSYAGPWASETFQLVGMLFNYKPMNDGYLPFRSFVFDANSFGGPTAVKPFTTTIEVTDPFSTESPGYGYGWSAYSRDTGFGFTWRISTNSVPLTIQTLKANDVYGD